MSIRHWTPPPHHIFLNMEPSKHRAVSCLGMAEGSVTLLDVKCAHHAISQFMHASPQMPQTPRLLGCCRAIRFCFHSPGCLRFIELKVVN